MSNTTSPVVYYALFNNKNELVFYLGCITHYCAPQYISNTDKNNNEISIEDRTYQDIVYYNGISTFTIDMKYYSNYNLCETEMLSPVETRDNKTNLDNMYTVDRSFYHNPR